MLMQELYNQQKKLDKHILKNMFGLTYITKEDHTAFLPQKFTAAFVEAGELAEAVHEKKSKEEITEEYVDILHFLLSIHNALNLNYWTNGSFEQMYNTSQQLVFFPLKAFNHTYIEFTKQLSLLGNSTRCFKFWSVKKAEDTDVQLLHFADTIFQYCKMGHTLGLEAQDVIYAYYQKNKVNHTRQESGY
jgi:dimeric dUTPase (all-alpha-NTP-PPase superfamily)